MLLAGIILGGLCRCFGASFSNSSELHDPIFTLATKRALSESRSCVTSLESACSGGGDKGGAAHGPPKRAGRREVFGGRGMSCWTAPRRRSQTTMGFDTPLARVVMRNLSSNPQKKSCEMASGEDGGNGVRWAARVNLRDQRDTFALFSHHE